jgi:hypothetical protein
VAFHCGSLVCRMLNMVSWMVLVASWAWQHMHSLPHATLLPEGAWMQARSGNAEKGPHEEAELIDAGFGQPWPAQHCGQQCRIGHHHHGVPRHLHPTGEAQVLNH